MGVQTVLVIGGTGGQGVPIVEDLSKHGYRVRVLTRDATSEHAVQLAKLPNVEFAIGSPNDDAAARAAFDGVDYAFVNLNSWVLGVKGEIFTGIRMFELAVQSGVKHYIWSSLDDYFLETKYDDSLRVGHYYGKGHVAQWMSAVPQTPMRWSVLSTGPYIEQLWYFQNPKKLESGEYDFRLPLDEGAIPYTCLDDLGYYVRWLLEHPERSAGLKLEVSVEHVSLPHLAQTFTEVTGQPARATNLTIDEWFSENGLGEIGKHRMGSSTAGETDPTLLTFYQNFSAWWRIYQRKGLLRRDYALLDEIYPGRTRSLKQWMERVGYNGDETRTYESGYPWGG